MSLLPDIGSDGKLIEEKLPVFVPRRRLPKDRYLHDDNFETLQNFGHKESSIDFSDSMFADRRGESNTAD